VKLSLIAVSVWLDTVLPASHRAGCDEQTEIHLKRPLGEICSRIGSFKNAPRDLTFDAKLFRSLPNVSHLPVRNSLSNRMVELKAKLK
jgi:hypothetical protein